MKNKIVLILPYFGKFKNYFEYFLTSVKNNSEVNFLVYTDNRVAYDYPENVKVVYTTFDEFVKRVQKIYSFPISLKKPYKLCDFKPAYGEILADDISEYDYWGHCDCDLIFGRIDGFLNDEILESNKKIFSRGHLTIYKNDSETNAYYRTQKKFDWKAIFQSEKSYAFDEWPGLSKAWHEEGRPCYDELVFDDIISSYEGFRITKQLNKPGLSPYHNQEDMSKKYKMMRHIIYRYEVDTGELYRIWLNGKGKTEHEKVLYAHFQKRGLEIDGASTCENFLIIPNRVIPDMETFNIRKLAPAKYTLKELCKMPIRKMKRIAKILLHKR